MSGPVPPASVAAVLAEGHVLHCAGGLMIEHPLIAPLVGRIYGSMDGLMGLSKVLVIRLLVRAAAAASHMDS